MFCSMVVSFWVYEIINLMFPPFQNQFFAHLTSTKCLQLLIWEAVQTRWTRRSVLQLLRFDQVFRKMFNYMSFLIKMFVLFTCFKNCHFLKLLFLLISYRTGVKMLKEQVFYGPRLFHWTIQKHMRKIPLLSLVFPDNLVK